MAIDEANEQLKIIVSSLENSHALSDRVINVNVIYIIRFVINVLVI